MEQALSAPAARIAADVATLSEPPYSDSASAVRRWAFTPGWAATLAWLDTQFTALGFTVGRDAVGTFVARNVAHGTPAFGIGSHPDSVRDGGAWDGTLGVVCALEIARESARRGLALPLVVLGFTEEEGSGFGEILLGSRIMAGHVSSEDLRERIRDQQGRPFATRAADHGLRPEAAAEAVHELDGLVGWLEIHIEQARRLETAGAPLGVVTAIAGAVHGDLVLTGRADQRRRHIDGPPTGRARSGATCIIDVERRAPSAERGPAATASWRRSVQSTPNRASATRSQHESRSRSMLAHRGTGHETLVDEALAAAKREAAVRGVRLAWTEHQRRPPRSLDPGLRTRLQDAAEELGLELPELPSGAAHRHAHARRARPDSHALRAVSRRRQPQPSRACRRAARCAGCLPRDPCGQQDDGSRGWSAAAAWRGR